MVNNCLNLEGIQLSFLLFSLPNASFLAIQSFTESDQLKALVLLSINIKVLINKSFNMYRYILKFKES